MNYQLIQGQHLTDSFLKLLPSSSLQTNKQDYSSGTSGSVLELSMDLKLKLSQIFMANALLDKQYKELFNGDLSKYDNDHSAGDLALIGYFVRQGLSTSEADTAFRYSKLYRVKWDSKRGAQTYGEITIKKAFEGAESPHVKQESKNTNSGISFLHHDNYQPTYHPQGMTARTFVGPNICIGTRLFPSKALSSLVALGGVGKTSVLMSIGIHLAAGKAWNQHPLTQQKVAMFFCEETQEEIDRKFSAIVDSWSLQDREKAIENFRAISFIGKDARLTLISGKQYTGSGMTEKILQLLEEFGLKDGLVIFDHTQGFTSGDLNSSETSTSICLEANKIVEATGAAVVLAAHVSKANINADSVGQGFAVGSLAFENATRQMSGMTHMSTEQAKKFGLEGLHKDYVRLGVAKNSYGEITDGLWLKKVFSLKFHTVVFEPVQLFIPISTGKLTANQRLSSQIKAHLAKHLFTTKNNLDALSGKDEDFKASKGKIRDAVKDLIDRGELIIHSITEEERELHHLPKQVKEVLRVA